MLKKYIFTKRFVLVISMIILTFIILPRKSALANDKNINNININNELTTEEVLLDDEKVNNQLDSLYNYINNMKSDIEIMNDLDPVEYIKGYIKNGEGNLSFKTISNAVISFLFKEVKTVLALSVSIIVIAIICSLLKNLQSAFSNEGLSNVAFFACYALLIIILSKSFIVSINIAVNIINELTNFMAAILPVLVTMIATIGGFTQAATMDPIVIGATLIIPRIYINIIIPLILITFVLEFTNNISTENKISNFCKLTKQITIWLQGIILTVFIGLLTVRGITSSTIDAVTLKTAKFAIDNFIPIVGKAFSDAIASVAGYSLIIKNAISSVGLIIIILMMLYPIIKLVLISFVYKLTAALIEPISDKRITNSIASAGDSLILIMSCVLSVSLMFFVLLAIMASAGKFVIGG
ncbi:stage III sporulation protein AE [Clostridium sp. CTA-7]